MAETVEVKVGQVWADNDPRSAGRTLRVDSVEGGRAVCTVLTNSNDHQRLLDNPPSGSNAADTRGRTVRISLARMRPTSTGYRLVTDARREA